MFSFEDRTRALLLAIEREGSVAAAARSLGWDASNALRHLRTAEGRARTSLVLRHRGGKRRRHATLTDRARDGLLEGGIAGIAQSYDADQGVTRVRVHGHAVFVSGNIRAGPIRITIDPRTVTLERGTSKSTRSSARNRIPVRVVRVHERPTGEFDVVVSRGRLMFRARVVRGALRELRIRKGSLLVANIKAVAVTAVAQPEATQ